MVETKSHETKTRPSVKKAQEMVHNLDKRKLRNKVIAAHLHKAGYSSLKTGRALSPSGVSLIRAHKAPSEKPLNPTKKPRRKIQYAPAEQSTPRDLRQMLKAILTAESLASSDRIAMALLALELK